MKDTQNKPWYRSRKTITVLAALTLALVAVVVFWQAQARATAKAKQEYVAVYEDTAASHSKFTELVAQSEGVAADCEANTGDQGVCDKLTQAIDAARIVLPEKMGDASRKAYENAASELTELNTAITEHTTSLQGALSAVEEKATQAVAEFIENTVNPLIAEAESLDLADKVAQVRVGLENASLPTAKQLQDDLQGAVETAKSAKAQAQAEAEAAAQAQAEAQASQRASSGGQNSNRPSRSQAPARQPAPAPAPQRPAPAPAPAPAKTSAPQGGGWVETGNEGGSFCGDEFGNTWPC